jgi:hypothetical protein
MTSDQVLRLGLDNIDEWDPSRDERWRTSTWSVCRIRARGHQELRLGQAIGRKSAQAA